MVWGEVASVPLFFNDELVGGLKTEPPFVIYKCNKVSLNYLELIC